MLGGKGERSMTLMTRRAALVGAAALAAAPEAGAVNLSAEMAAHPGYRAWNRTHAGSETPMDVFVDTGSGPKRLRDWMEGRPAAVALWATWCGPCLVEKPNQAAMSARLQAAGARTRILIVQAYDTVTLEAGRRTLTRLRAAALPNARATPAAEAAFIGVFGASPRDRTRTSMPSLLLINADGTELGRAVGTMTGVDGETDYWQDDSTFEFLRQL
jgi:thiol-disulfide isomerase/thioredoxin